jgi:protein involved in polysaccharide export with SLBB domain
MVTMSCSPRQHKRDPLPAPETEYRLGRGDSIAVTFQFNDNFNDNQVIRPDGKISLPVIGEVHASGLKPKDLEKLLEAKYSEELINPEITVALLAIDSNKVYVCGSVIRPGPVRFENNMSVVQAIMEAGGFNRRTAELENVIVIRHKNNKRYATSINMKKAFEQVISDPLVLTRYDIVYVPQKRIVEINMWLDQYIHRIIAGVNFPGEDVGYNGIATTNTDHTLDDGGD